LLIRDALHLVTKVPSVDVITISHEGKLAMAADDEKGEEPKQGEQGR
jgi:hypothetical protein